MTAAILCIGTELTRGEILNTNASWLATKLTAMGFEVTAIETVDDHEARIQEALGRLGSRHRVVVCSGGLGPTTDDITSAAVAKMLGVSLIAHGPSLDALQRRYEKIGRAMSLSSARQADVPEGSTVLSNEVGAAPGFAVQIGQATTIFLPGVPREVEHLWDHQAAALLRPFGVLDSHQIRLQTFGMAESVLNDRLAGLEESMPGLRIGYRVRFPEIEVKVLVKAPSQEAARAQAHAAADEVRSRLGDVVYGEGDDTLPETVARAMRSRGWRLALAESCTGGLLGHLLTEFPASEFFVADAVTYANSAKTRLLGVDEDVLRGHGAVSAEVAAAMAEGIRRVCEVDISLAVTGIAGPTGGSPEKPIGLVYWSVAHPGGTLVEHRVLGGDRRQIQQMAAYVGLSLLRRICLAERQVPSPRASTSVDVAG
jgi:nicotinamide-nucleotide amidase